MSYTMGVIREFETKQFRVVVDALPEEDLDLSFDDTGEVAEKLNNGTYVAFVARARVLHTPSGAELSCDYLRGCIYESLEAFMDHKECGKQNREYEAKGESGRCGSYFSDMIHTVCEGARKELAKLQNVRVRATF